MKRTLSLSRALPLAALLTMIAATSNAAGLNLSWGDCGTFGTLQRNFACTTNTGANTMVGSVITGVVMSQLNSEESVMSLQTDQAALSNWWQLATGGCRANTPPFISPDFNFLSNVNCLDPWAGAGAGGLNYTPGFNVPNRARIRTICAIPGSTSITDTDEYYLFKVTFTNARTTGTGSCGGCTDGACILLNSVKLTQPLGVGDFTFTDLQPITRNYVLWQAGGDLGGACPAVVPTRNQTWGSVKSLYR